MNQDEQIVNVHVCGQAVGPRITHDFFVLYGCGFPFTRAQMCYEFRVPLSAIAIVQPQLEFYRLVH